MGTVASLFYGFKLTNDQVDYLTTKSEIHKFCNKCDTARYHKHIHCFKCGFVLREDINTVPKDILKEDLHIELTKWCYIKEIRGEYYVVVKETELKSGMIEASIELCNDDCWIEQLSDFVFRLKLQFNTPKWYLLAWHC